MSQAQIDHTVSNPIEPSDASTTGLGNQDTGTSDLDSIYESEVGSLTDSLTSYVTRYKYLHGRRYDSKQQYIVANDEAQQNQMDIFHEIYYRVLRNKLYVAPIVAKPERILDLGTGTGIWAVDIADMHPSAAVVGTDIAPIQPSWVPPNCEFQVDDYNDEWTFTKNSFDFIHARAIHDGVKDWSKLFGKIYSALKPGGYVEFVAEDVELYCDDKTLPDDSPMKQWMKGMREGAAKMGLDLMPYHKPFFKEGISNAGFDMSTYKHEIFPCPLGTWPKAKEQKEVGGMMLVNMLQGVDGWSLYIYTQIHGKPVEEFNQLVQTWHKDLKNKKQHKYLKINVIYVQKPMGAAPTSQHTVS